LYPVASGYYSLNDKLDLTFYGIMWSDIPNGSGGFGSWTEWGGGVNIKVAGGALGINPQVGILAGTLLSKSTRPVVGEGIVPSLTANLNTKKIEGQFYFGYYMPLVGSDKLPAGTDGNTFVHYWTYLGYKMGIVSAGLHFERLDQPVGAVVNGEKVSLNVYSWLGPYVAFNIKNQVFKITAGPNTSGDVNRSRHDGFYKLQYIFNF
jgi:hypothetical protein